jgi:hypothetical protein
MTADEEQGSEPTGWRYYIKLAIETVRLNRRAMEAAAADGGALRFGLVATALGGGFSVLFHTGWEGVVLFSFFSVASIFLFSAFLHLFAGYTKGKVEFTGLVRIVALSGIIDWLAVIPVAALVVTVWSVVIAVVAVQEVYGLSKGRAVFCVMMAACALWIVTLVLFSGPLGQWYGVSSG